MLRWLTKNVWYLSTDKKIYFRSIKAVLKAYWYCGGYGFSEIIEAFRFN
jgi:hypothetical protein